MSDNNKRIPELPAMPTANVSQLFAVYDPSSDVTYRVSLQQIKDASGFIPDQWNPLTDYIAGNIVSHDYGFGQQVWVAVINSTGSEPTGSNTDWRLATATDLNLKSYDGTTPTLFLNAGHATEVIFATSDVDGDRLWQVDNLENLLRMTVFITFVGLGGSFIQDMSAVVPYVRSDNGNWDGDLKQWAPIQAGTYKLVFEYNGQNFLLSISNLFF